MMTDFARLMFVGLVFVSVAGCEAEQPQRSEAPVSALATSVVTRTDANELILVQELTVSAPVAEAWRAYTTAEGWTAWAAPKAELSASWPEIMQSDADKLSNVVLFDEVAAGVTRLQSFGIGYTDAPEYDDLMGFFIKANEGLCQNLRAYLETGARVEWSQ